jgi:hypothetical protein
MGQNWLEHFTNPQGTAFKRYLYEILKDKYPKHHDIIERIAANLQTEGDLQNFSALVIELFEMAYAKAVEDYKGELKKMGYKVDIVQKPIN